MRLLDILRLRDRTIKNELIRRIKPRKRRSTMKVIDRAFQKGAKRWEEYHLSELLGRRRSRRLLRMTLNKKP